MFSHQSFVKISHWTILAYALVASLSIAAAQIAVICLISYSVMYRIFVSRSEEDLSLDRRFIVFTSAVVTWILASFVSSLIGIDLYQAFPELLKTSLYLLFPFCVFYALSPRFISRDAFRQRIRLYFSLLIFSQAAAAMHTIVSAAARVELAPGLPGSVTEAGQLVLVIPIALAMLVSDNAEDRYSTNRLLTCALLVLMFLTFAWPDSFLLGSLVSFTTQFQVLVGILSLTLFIWAFLKYRATGDRFIYWIGISLLFAALVLTLKRGPWLAVFIELLILGLFISKRLLVAAVSLTFAALALLAPVRERVLDLVEHFTIHGGRQSMWAIGIELLERFPLGLGLDNARHMQKVDPSLPELHRHMHNNLLNVAVESGWIGLAAYLWWMVVIVSLGFIIWSKTKDSIECKETQKVVRISALCLSVALIGWQTSGLVEYNFGDGEIRLLAFFVMGILLAIYQHFLAPCSNSDEAES